MNPARLLAHSLTLSALLVVSGGQVWAQFPAESDEDFRAKLKAAIATIKPLPETPIPDDPPPHEGALIDLPYVVEPPDLLVIEVLEALPGRPISGEHLVRPDGRISLGFYGEVDVRGLTLEQVKVKVVEHLRQFLPDEVLGLVETEVVPVSGKPGAPPATPPERELLDPRPPADKGPSARPKTSSSGPVKGRTAGGRKAGPAGVVALAKYEPDETPATTVTLPAGGNVTIRIEIQTGKPAESEAAKPGFIVPEEHMKVVHKEVAPAASNRVFVDMSAYNSKFYYVQGDVAAPGKLPWTGGETLLDALTHAGGLIPSADPNNIRLIRPARGGKPEKVIPIDHKAIFELGIKHLNYQLFPGDRIVVGRNKVVQTTVVVDRLATAYQALANGMAQGSSVARNLVQATPDLTPAQREALLKEWFELVWKAAQQTDGPTLDESTLRERLLRHLKTPPQPASPPKEK
jgi:protein involved in polysaccharide export with SLBB domain